MIRTILLYSIALSAASAAEDEIDFNRDVRPILSENCFFCHGPDKDNQKAGLRLDSYEDAIKDNDGVRAIDPEDLQNSELLYRIISDDSDDIMPPPESHKTLSKKAIETLTKWVNAGAPYAEHWSFAAIEPADPPADSGNWAKNPIDNFILEKLQKSGLDPSPEADRVTAFRRATLDLTGLPPTPAEVDKFLGDTTPDAYEKAVDRLLASTAYGERMATSWMDIARYGDTSVMHADGNRTMWPWRDWVINAYNANKPFDEFTVEQLAGDLLPGASLDQKIASGFNRNSASSDEGGAFPEELRVGYAIDRVQATTSTWLGLSVECAQCHDHKYDPISHQEYFEIFAFFNQAADPGMQSRRGNQAPLVRFFTDPALEARHAEASAKLAHATAATKAHKNASGPGFDKWLTNATPADLAEPGGLAHRFTLDPESDTPFTDTITGTEPTTPGEKFSVTKRDKPTVGSTAGINFEGTGPRTYPEDIAAFDVNDPFTIAAWIYTPNNGDGRAIVSRMQPQGGKESFRGFDIWTDGLAIGTHIVYRWPNRGLKVMSKAQLEPDTWQHVAISYDGSRTGSSVSIFIDGEKVETAIEKNTLKDGKELAVARAPFIIGARAGDPTVPAGIADLRIYDRVLNNMERDLIGNRTLVEVLARKERTPEETAELKAYYLASADPRYGQLLASEGDLKKKVDELESRKISSMIMGDVGEHRQTYVLDRGSYDSPKTDEPVQPDVPDFLPPLPRDAPRNRLSLAKWIVSEENPLTPRVTMNRYWSMFFGRGLVSSTADFGNQGSVPTHPDLLDWLAADFVDSGWDVKHALRQIVTSATYRQQSNHREDITGKDPENLLLARSPRFRLKGEFIRDAALQKAGLLNTEVGGPGVKPYQPAGLWNEVSLDANVRFRQDKGEDLYRRSLYTFWKRSAPQPAMTTFDAPTREICTIERPRTNTPLQALVTLNDTQFVEAARAFAQRIIKEGGASERERILFAFRLATAREPDEKEISLVAQALGAQLASYRGEKQKAKELLETGESPRDSSLDPIEHAAWTNVASLLLNLDETITRG